MLALGSQVLDTWCEPAMLGTKGVILPSTAAWYPGALKFGLMYNEAREGQLSSEEVHPCCGPVGLRGVEVMVGAVGLMIPL